MASWPLKASTREEGVKSLVTFCTPEENTDLDVGRVRTEML